jgi:hypothetical protein
MRRGIASGDYSAFISPVLPERVVYEFNQILFA